MGFFIDLYPILFIHIFTGSGIWVVPFREEIIMRRAIRFLSNEFFIGVFLVVLLPAVTLGAPYAFVTNYGAPGNFVSVIDMATNAVVGSPISVGGEPWGIAVNPAGTRAYVANSASDSVTVIDAQTRAVIGSPIPVGDFPIEVAIHPDGSKVYVSNFSSNSVSVINTTTNTVTKTLYVGNQPYGIAVNPLGTRAYVACNKSDINAIYIINTETDTVYPTPLYVGSNPTGVVVSPDSTRVYVSNSGSNNVSVIDAVNAIELTKISTPYNPGALSISPDGSRL
jgi:YVTN family beta-propeller protein